MTDASYIRYVSCKTRRANAGSFEWKSDTATGGQVIVPGDKACPTPATFVHTRPNQSFLPRGRHSLTLVWPCTGCMRASRYSVGMWGYNHMWDDARYTLIGSVAPPGYPIELHSGVPTDVTVAPGEMVYYQVRSVFVYHAEHATGIVRTHFGRDTSCSFLVTGTWKSN